MFADELGESDLAVVVRVERSKRILKPRAAAHAGAAPMPSIELGRGLQLDEEAGPPGSSTPFSLGLSLDEEGVEEQPGVAEARLHELLDALRVVANAVPTMKLTTSPIETPRGPKIEKKDVVVEVESERREVERDEIRRLPMSRPKIWLGSFRNGKSNPPADS